MARGSDDDDFDFDFDDDFDDDDFSDDDFDDDDLDDDFDDLDDEDDEDFDLDDDDDFDDLDGDDDDDFDDFDDLDDDESVKKNKVFPIIAGFGILIAVGLGAWFMIPTGDKSDDTVTASEVVSSTETTTETSESVSESTTETSTSETPTTSEEPEPVTGAKTPQGAAEGFIKAFYVDGSARDAVSFFDPVAEATVFGTQEEIDSYTGTSTTFSVDKVDSKTFNATVKATGADGSPMEIPMSLNMVERESRWYVESIGSPVDSSQT